MKGDFESFCTVWAWQTKSAANIPCHLSS